MKCHDIKNRLELYLDNELPAQEKAEIEAHLLNCSACTKEFANLKSLNSLGKTEFLPQPSPSYWNELRHNIMNEIKAADKKSINLSSLLQKFKNYIFPPKLSFRLAGLVATAVIIFFIIHISFLRQGKFELPQESDLQDSILVSKQKAQSIEIKEKEMPEAPSLAKAPVPQATPKVTSFQDTGGDQLSILQKEPQVIVNIPDREIGKLQAPVKLIEQESKVADGELVEEQDRKKGISDKAVPSRKEAKRVMEKAASMSNEKRAMAEKDAFQIQSVGASKSTAIPDASIFEFSLTHQKVLAVSEMTEKIKIWEEYVQTQPELDLLRKAKHEQSRLYFDLAQEKMNDDQVTQAINFYEKNFEYLAAVADSFQIEQELDTLRQLLKKR